MIDAVKVTAVNKKSNSLLDVFIHNSAVSRQKIVAITGFTFRHAEFFATNLPRPLYKQW